MLSYAFQHLTPKDYEKVEKTKFDNIHNMLASILASGIGKQLKQGLYREYVEHRENLLVIHGKIHMPETIQNFVSRKQQISCEYDEFSENNLLNQILKSTVVLLIRHETVDEKYKIILKREMLFFSNVNEVNLKAIRWNSIRFHKHNNSYRMIISICQLITEGMLLTTDPGEYRLSKFIDKQAMSRLYEKFILEFYRKECPQVKANPSQIKWDVKNYGTHLPVMQSDITLSQGNNVLIIDAKYYDKIMKTKNYSCSLKLNSSHLYQIFTYVKNKDAEFRDGPHSVSGMLLYAMTNEPIKLNEVYEMGRNMIHVKTLDLNCEFPEISKQLKTIVESYFTIPNR